MHWFIGWATAVAIVSLFAPAASAQVTFTNSSGIVIPDVGTAMPYPSAINVSGYTGTITDITVTLTDFTHTFVDDIGVFMSGPTGQTTLLFDGGPDGGTGAGGTGTPISLLFSAMGSMQIPAGGSNLDGGTYLPGLDEYGDTFAAPAPARPYGTSFASFIGSAPNGTYNLWIQDFVGGDGGNVASWSITISGISLIPEPTSLALVSIPALGGMIWRRRRAKVAAG